MKYIKKLYYDKMIVEKNEIILALKRENKKLSDELNDTRVKYENIRHIHKYLCKKHNELRKKYLKLKQPFSYFQKWEEVKGEKL